MNPFVILTLGVWLIACIACFATKNSDPICVAFLFTVIAGIGYFLLVDKS